ncbi:hypothetical protein [Komarekiella delphini-convector]|uniref:hypothetical protein n=1 Tax=Komarekiella delphini-convector TaxID=3050158 RepID=UPI00178665F9|nr:hypothetical protein [Komarekiella delphini-convector]
MSKSIFFNVDAERLAAGYRQRAADAPEGCILLQRSKLRGASVYDTLRERREQREGINT